ncbi:GNAT family N-acetyltransferase [Actinoplanes sp. NPDC051851]|uniref:GNAT family N-acetyltransferase n=1 Tax=Actinoplanes sp. NPDC051851 TaxID=3154753 RepID=UPI00342BDE14
MAELESTTDAQGAVPDLELVALKSNEQLAEAAGLLHEVWGARSEAARGEVMSTSLLRALSHSGNYVVGAYRGGKLLGCTVGMFGSLTDGRPDQLHSYMAGVLPALSSRGIGYAMKRHQLRWALTRDIETITWTFDPLVSRNAYFNLCKLGVSVDAYEPDFYGRIDDGANTGQETDRLLVTWDLRNEWVTQAMAGELGEMRRHASVLPEAELIVVPKDIGTARAAIQAERVAVRERFQSLIADGYRVAGMSKAWEYVLLPEAVRPVYEP